MSHQRQPDPRIGNTSQGGIDRLDASMSAAVSFIRDMQLPSGAWISDEHFEPRTSSVHLITLAFLDRVPLVEARGYARFLATLQRDDGSFPAHPFAEAGDLSATALVYAALRVADLPDQQDARARALRFVEENGGFGEVVRFLPEKGDLTAVYLAMAGVVDPNDLPDPELGFMAVPGLLRLMLRRINAGIVWVMLFVGGVTWHLRRKSRPPRGVSGLIRSLLYGLVARRSVAFVESWLNPNGNANGTTVQSDMALATLVAFGRSPESPSVGACLAWFDKHKNWDDRGLHLRAFYNHNWQTALCLRALHYAGAVGPDDMIDDGLDFLCWSQSKLPMPWVNLRRRDAQRTGGWGFEDDNLILPDMDDTGTVVNALGLCLSAGSEARLGEARTERVRAAVDAGLCNIVDMQNPDGGWSAFVWNLGSKEAGPIYDKPIPVPETFADKVRFFLRPPVELQEPAVSGVTGRVLQGLGALGFSAEALEVIRAARFLEARQMPAGCWWSRWLVAYLPSTASVISGLADCGWDMTQPWVVRGIDWLISCQNPDGGWGETPAAYDDPGQAGRGPSMPPVTGMVLGALIDAGWSAHPAVAKGVEYLLGSQEPDGSWPSNGWLQVYEPNATYYFFEGAAWTTPLEAMGKYRKVLAPRRREGQGNIRLVDPEEVPDGDPPRHRPSFGSLEHLAALRSVSDPVADQTIRALVTDADRLDWRALTGTPTIAGSGKPLPPEVGHFFRTTSRLPEWADQALIEQGQRVFGRHGWLMVAGLFCSSIPHTYCAADCARVLVQTHEMVGNVQRRIFNTARFLIDVSREGGFRPDGRGLRSAQKIRLMHALTRYRIQKSGAWDMRAWGVPVNEADMLGALMAFSVVVLDAAERAGARLSQSDREGYLHLWKVTGSLLGIRDAQLPADMAEARELTQGICAHTWAPSAHGRLLAAQLVRGMRHYVPESLRALPVAAIRFLAGDRCADMLGLPTARSVERVLGAGALGNRLLPLRMGQYLQWWAGSTVLSASRREGLDLPPWLHLPGSLTERPKLATVGVPWRQ